MIPSSCRSCIFRPLSSLASSACPRPRPKPTFPRAGRAMVECVLLVGFHTGSGDSASGEADGRGRDESKRASRRGGNGPDSQDGFLLPHPKSFPRVRPPEIPFNHVCLSRGFSCRSSNFVTRRIYIGDVRFPCRVDRTYSMIDLFWGGILPSVHVSFSRGFGHVSLTDLHMHFVTFALRVARNLKCTRWKVR